MDKGPGPASCSAGMAEPSVAKLGTLECQERPPRPTHSLSSCFVWMSHSPTLVLLVTALTLTWPAAGPDLHMFVSCLPAVMCTVPRASWLTSKRCWRTSFCHCLRLLCTLPATRSCTSFWSM